MQGSRNDRRVQASGPPASARTAGFADQLVTTLPALERWASSLAGPGEEARDLASETVVRALAGRDSFDQRRPVLPWLLRIAYRQHHAQLRRQSQDQARALATARLARLPPVEAHDPAEIVERRELQQQVRDALGEISARHRAILLTVAGGGVTR